MVHRALPLAASMAFAWWSHRVELPSYGEGREEWREQNKVSWHQRGQGLFVLLSSCTNMT